MSDVLKAPVGFGMSANLLSQLGLVPMSDNYGNETRGMMLTCTGRPPLKMTGMEAADLHYAILPRAALAFNLKGEINLGELESPLEVLCEKREQSPHTKIRLDSHKR